MTPPLKKGLSEGHREYSRRVSESTLGGSARVLSEGQREFSLRVRESFSLTVGCSKGSDILTCPAQPGHGGKRRDSSEERVSSAIIEFMQEIDHKPKNLNETQYSDIRFGPLEWHGATSS